MEPVQATAVGYKTREGRRGGPRHSTYWDSESKEAIDGDTHSTEVSDRRWGRPDARHDPVAAEAAADYHPRRRDRHVASRQEETQDPPAPEYGGRRRAVRRVLGH